MAHLQPVLRYLFLLLPLLLPLLLLLRCATAPCAAACEAQCRIQPHRQRHQQTDQQANLKGGDGAQHGVALVVHIPPAALGQALRGSRRGREEGAVMLGGQPSTAETPVASHAANHRSCCSLPMALF